MDPKQRAAEAALDYLRSDTVIGVGTGSTANFFIAALGEALRTGRLSNIRGVPTSVQSQRLAEAKGIPLLALGEAGELDVTVDGADEIDERLNLIKGLGGALLREKIVAQNSRRLVIIADESKRVQTLGRKCPLPVEVAQFGHEVQARFLRSLRCEPALRRNEDGSAFITDNGNYIYDCRFDGIDDPEDLDRLIGARAGIVETGLFLGMASVTLVGGAGGVKTSARPE